MDEDVAAVVLIEADRDPIENESLKIYSLRTAKIEDNSVVSAGGASQRACGIFYRRKYVWFISERNRYHRKPIIRYN